MNPLPLRLWAISVWPWHAHNNRRHDSGRHRKSYSCQLGCNLNQTGSQEAKNEWKKRILSDISPINAPTPLSIKTCLAATCANNQHNQPYRQNTCFYISLDGLPFPAYIQIIRLESKDKLLFYISYFFYLLTQKVKQAAPKERAAHSKPNHDNRPATKDSWSR